MANHGGFYLDDQHEGMFLKLKEANKSQNVSKLVQEAIEKAYKEMQEEVTLSSGATPQPLTETERGLVNSIKKNYPPNNFITKIITDLIAERTKEGVKISYSLDQLILIAETELKAEGRLR
jgi:hypothetical protein